MLPHSYFCSFYKETKNEMTMDDYTFDQLDNYLMHKKNGTHHFFSGYQESSSRNGGMDGLLLANSENILTA